MTKIKFFLPLSIILLLGGCAQPHAIPSGYTYHDGEYKSALPPQSSKVTKAQRQAMGPRQAQQFRTALYDLVDHLTDRAGMPPKPVYVIPHEPMNTFYAQVDNDLREAMRHTGYTLAPSSEGVYAFTYEAQLIEQPALDEQDYPDVIDPNAENIEIILQVFDGAGEEATQLTEERGRYRIDGAEHYFGTPLTGFNAAPSREDNQ